MSETLLNRMSAYFFSLFNCFRNNNSFKGKRKPLCKQCGNCTKCKTCKCNNEIIIEDLETTYLFEIEPR